MGLTLLDVGQDIAKDLIRPLIGIDVGDEFGSVILEHGLGFLFVGTEPARDDLVVDVVEAVVLERAALQAVVNLGLVGAGEMEHPADVDFGAENLGLVAIARDAIEHEEIDVGLETARTHHAVDLRGPESDADVVGHELASAGVFDKSLAEGRSYIHGAENVATGAVIKTGNRSNDFALGSFARPRCAEEKEGFVDHDFGNVPIFADYANLASGFGTF
jgi:hypothetical protein